MKILKINLALVTLLFAMALSAQTVMKIPFLQPKAFTVSPASVNKNVPEGGSIILGLDATITGGSGVYTYNWSLGDVELSTELTLTVDKPGNYMLLISDGKGCQSSVMYYVTTGSTAISQTKGMSMMVYPNPTEGSVTILLKDEKILEKIEIITPDGRIIAKYTGKDIQVENNKIALDLKDLPKGSYLISLHSGKNIKTNVLILR